YVTVKELFEMLANKPVKDEEVKALYTGVYPDIEIPSFADSIIPEHIQTQRLKDLAVWEREKGAQIKHRETCYNLYSGDGLGSQSEAAKGTAWGVYNAVVEYEQYLKRYGQSASFLFGAGAKRVERAYDLAVGLAQS